MMNVLGARALVTRLDEPAQKSNLIEVVEFEKRPSQFAFVVAVGNGGRLNNGERQPLDFKAGDLILTAPYCGSPVQFTMPGGIETEGFMITEDDVLAVLEKTDEETDSV